MPRRTGRNLRLPALLIAGAMVLAACGDDEDPTDVAAEGDATTTTAAEATTTTAGATTTGGATATGDGTLTIGTLLPETGSLAFLGPPEVAAVQLAVNEINAAGGVLGNDVALVTGDSGDTTTDIANQTVDRLLAAKADTIIGAASSGVTLTVIDKITGAGVVQISPANTAKSLTDYNDRGLYFRTAPSDLLQGQVLGEIIVEEGNQRVGILALQDPYGEGLAEDLEASIEESGGEVVAKRIYDPNAQTFDAEVQEMKTANPDAIVVIGFDESARIITNMIEQGIGPGQKKVYGTDGNMGNALGEQFTQPGALNGMKGTTPLSELTSDFRQRLLAVNPGLVDFNYAGESYDATVLASLAAIAAESDAGTAIAEELVNVSKGGEKCESFADCKALLEADASADIDYDGISGPVEFTDDGDPGSASYGVLTFGPDNKIVDSATTYRQAEL